MLELRLSLWYVFFWHFHETWACEFLCMHAYGASVGGMHAFILYHAGCRAHDISGGEGRLDRAAWLAFVTKRQIASDILPSLDTVLKVKVRQG